MANAFVVALQGICNALTSFPHEQIRPMGPLERNNSLLAMSSIWVHSEQIQFTEWVKKWLA
jgi:hypothetical protein